MGGLTFEGSRILIQQKRIHAGVVRHVLDGEKEGRTEIYTNTMPLRRFVIIEPTDGSLYRMRLGQYVNYTDQHELISCL